MIKNIGRIWNYSDAYRRVTQHHISQKKINTNSDKKIDDKKSNSIKPIKSTKNNKAVSITKLCNFQIKIKESFTTLNYRT